MRHPDARSERYSSNAVLPTPGSPRRTSTRLSPALARATRRSSAAHSALLPLSVVIDPHAGGVRCWDGFRPFAVPCIVT